MAVSPLFLDGTVFHYVIMSRPAFHPSLGHRMVRGRLPGFEAGFTTVRNCLGLGIGGCTKKFGLVSGVAALRASRCATVTARCLGGQTR